MPRRRPQPFVNFGKVRTLLGVSYRTLHKMSTEGDFPRPIQLRPHKHVYLLAELNHWWRQHRDGDFPLAADGDTEPEAVAS